MLLVIHGSFARILNGWWRIGEPFPSYLQSVSSRTVHSFSWSGGITPPAIQTGANDLVAWINANQPTNSLYIVAHSNGGNVAMLATRQTDMIDRLILMGTPLLTNYVPDLRNVGIIYNVYSFGDHIQNSTLATLSHRRGEGRTLGDSQKLVNFLADDGHGGWPDHSDLHTEAIWRANNFEQLVS